MKITKSNLKKIITEYFLNEITPEIIAPGIGDAKRATVQAGGFRDDTGVMVLTAELIADFTPLGPAIDTAHLAIALKRVAETGGEDGKTGATFAAMGFIPGAGGVLKKLGTALKNVPANKVDDVIDAAVDSSKKSSPEKFAKTTTKAPDISNAHEAFGKTIKHGDSEVGEILFQKFVRNFDDMKDHFRFGSGPNPFANFYRKIKDYAFTGTVQGAKIFRKELDRTLELKGCKVPESLKDKFYQNWYEWYRQAQKQDAIDASDFGASTGKFKEILEGFSFPNIVTLFK